MRNVLGVFLLGGCLLVAGGASSPLAHAAPRAPAEEASDEGAARAKQRFEQGVIHFNLGEYEAAVAEFTAAYRERPLPELLYNIAQAYRRGNKPQEALAFYRRYLGATPQNREHAEVLGLVEQLEAELARSAASRPRPRRWLWPTVGTLGGVAVVGIVLAVVLTTVPHPAPSTDLGEFRPMPH